MNDNWDIINDQFWNMDAGHIYGKMITSIEKIVIIKILERSQGNQIAAAKLLGLHRNTLRKKIKKLNIDVRKFKR